MIAAPGQAYRMGLVVDEDLVRRFADLSGDRNPIHLDPAEARAYGYPRRVAHGAILVALVSKVIGMEVPGPGSVWMGQSVDWLHPVFVGDRIEVTVTEERASEAVGVHLLALEVRNQEGTVVMKGKAKVKSARKVVPSADGARAGTRVALVTGAAGGLGGAVASRLAADGCAVALACHRSEDDARRRAGQIEAAGGRAAVFVADLADEHSAAGLVREAAAAFGRLDVIVHAASPRIAVADAKDLAYAVVEPYLKVYLGGALALTSAAAPGMAERRFGRLIFIGTAALHGEPPNRWWAYLAAKHALWGLVRSLAAELGPSGITANMVCPGLTVTDMTADIPARVKEVEARRNPMRRLASPDDTAAVVSFLAGDTSGYINGAQIPITGGPT